MRLWKSWIVTQKDLSVFKRKQVHSLLLVALPIILGVVLPVIFVVSLQAQASVLTLTQTVDAA